MRFFDEATQQEVVRLYTDLKYSVAKIAIQFKCNRETIRKLLIKNNIQIRDNNIYKCKLVNDTYFDVIDTPEKAYILGFIYADGCLTKGNALEIKLALHDKDILEKIRSCLGSNHTIGIYKNNNGYALGNMYCTLNIVNKHLHDKLVSWGATEKKTKTLVFPKFLDDNLVSHFVRGFFDGDGSVYEIKQCSFIGCSFTGTYDMLENIRQICEIEFGTKAKVHKYRNKDIYDFKIGGKNNVIAFYKYIYKDATIFLGRKKLLFDKYLNLSRKTFNDYNTTSECH